MIYVTESHGDEWEAIDDFEAENLEEAKEKVVEHVRSQAMGDEGEEVHWFMYLDTGDSDNDHKRPLAKGSFLL